jgi:predicted MFS family arabinose efflux permease
MAVGVILAMTSAGFAWSPYNNAVHQEVRDEMRPRSLSIVSTGTSLGVAIAGLVALALIYAGVSWRIAWAIFAGAGVLAFAGNWFAMEDVAGNPGGPNRSGWKTLWNKNALPLYAVALSFGITTTIFISFATDRVAQAGGLSGLPDRASPAVMFITYGIVGLSGLTTAVIKEHIGLANLIRLLLVISATSLGLIAFTPTSWAGVLVASGLQGLFVMMMSAVRAFWSERLFPELPSLSFTATLLAVASGSVICTAVAGFVSSAVSPDAMFMVAAALSAITAASVLPRLVKERASDSQASAAG